MNDKEKRYDITYEECKKRIFGVCSHCGGELVPMETVNNADEPTFWAGCERCQIICWGVKPKIFEIAKLLVTKKYYTPLGHLSYPDGKNKDYEKYWTESQTGSACNIVLDMLTTAKELGIKDIDKLLEKEV